MKQVRIYFASLGISGERDYQIERLIIFYCNYERSEIVYH